MERGTHACNDNDDDDDDDDDDGGGGGADVNDDEDDDEDGDEYAMNTPGRVLARMTRFKRMKRCTELKTK